jgi:hypothetical protein
MAPTTQLQWQPTIGDPSLFGWITVVAYALAAALAGLVSMRRARDCKRLDCSIWLVVTASMVFLGINKQLDLQVLVMEIGRSTAQAQGWYEKRRAFQRWFVLSVIAAAGGITVWFFVRFCSFWMTHRLLVIGLISLITFIVVRAVSFHHFDVLLATTVAGIKVHRILELAGVSLVVVAGVQELLIAEG